MTLTNVMLWLLLVVVAALAGVGVAILQQGRRPQKTLTKKKTAPVNAETVYSELGENPNSASLDMDPISEAEVYLAYGNKEAALRVLGLAARAMPGRTDLLAKIEEIRAGDRKV